MRGRVNGLAGAGFSGRDGRDVPALRRDGRPGDAGRRLVTVAAVLGLALVGVAHRGWPHRAIERAATRVYTP